MKQEADFAVMSRYVLIPPHFISAWLERYKQAALEQHGVVHVQPA